MRAGGVVGATMKMLARPCFFEAAISSSAFLGGQAGGRRPRDGAAPRGLLIAGADKAWKKASGRIDGTELIVSSPEVAAPVAVRYAWAENPDCNLVNGADLPATSFRTDDWPAPAAKK